MSQAALSLSPRNQVKHGMCMRDELLWLHAALLQYKMQACAGGEGPGMPHMTHVT